MYLYLSQLLKKCIYNYALNNSYLYEFLCNKININIFSTLQSKSITTAISNDVLFIQLAKYFLNC
jgi:hypothetical protein